MEKRVVPRNRPASRGNDSPSPSPSLSSPSPSSSSHHHSSSSSSSPSSLRTMEVLPPEPVSLSLSRPSTASSRPHSPSLSSLSRPSSSSSSRPPSSPNHSPLGSPVNGRRKAKEKEIIKEKEIKEKEKDTKELGEQNGVFLTSLRGESSLSNYDESNDQSTTLNGVDEQDVTIQNEEDLERMEAMQAARRAELDSYMLELQHKKDIVIFPKNFNEILETFETEQMGANSFWAKFMMDPAIDDPWVVDEKLAKGLERIRKLDILLAKKTKQANEFQRANKPKAVKEEKTKKDKKIPAPPQLTQLDEQRIEAILAAEEDEIENYISDIQSDIMSNITTTTTTNSDTQSRASVRTPFEELEGILDIDVKLADLVPTTEWDNKGLSHMRPSSATSRASYSSLSSLSSLSSYSTYLSLASRTSMGSQALKELEKEREEETTKEKARMREIDAKLRELAQTDARLARAGDALRMRAHAGDAENSQEIMEKEEEEEDDDIETATPDEIRRLVRMLSSKSLA